MKNDIGRIHILDFIRGFAIIGMVVYHAVFDLTAFYNVQIPLFDTTIINIIWLIFALAFIIISGISTGLSRNPIRRGIIVILAAGVVSAVTFIVTPDLAIRFGILHFMGSAMLLTALLKKPLAAIPRFVALPLFAALFSISYFLFPIDSDINFLFPIGVISNGFSSADYYPLIPWIFAFFFGTYLAKPLLEHRAPKWVYDFQCPFINFCGRQTLWIFLFHQPVLLAIFWVIFNFI